MTRYEANIAEMSKYCVLCGKEYGPHLKECCTHNSLVAIKREGVLRKRIRFFALDGRELDENGLSAIREIAVATRDSADREAIRQPGRLAADESKAAPAGSSAKRPIRDAAEGSAETMMNCLWLFALVLGIPLIAFAVAEGIQAYFNSELRSAARGRYTDVDPNALSQLSIDRLCETPDPKLRDICDTNRNLNLMSAGGIWAGGIGLALVFAIRLAGSAARTNRRLLLYLFKPGLYLTVLSLVGLVLVHAGLIMAAIYYGESILVGRVHIFIIGAIGVGAFLGIAVMVPNVFSLVRKAQTLVIGKIISREHAPALWEQIAEIAQKLGALHPEQIVVGLDPNFFVTEADVICLDGRLSGRTLYCSLPLSRILTREEFLAVIGHELGHYQGLDTEFSLKFFPIYRGTASSIASLQETGGEGYRMIALLPAIAVLSYFLECFSVAESRISRSRELAADQAGVAVSNATTMASALVKIHAFTRVWEGLQQAAVQALREGKAFVNASKTYAEAVSGYATPDALDGIAETHLSHPTDTHPPLSERLRALGLSINDVAAAALEVRPSQPTIELVPEAEQLEENISGAYQAILAQRLGIDLEAGAAASQEGDA
jgi:Zn-dependent protease with chaperone function